MPRQEVRTLTAAELAQVGGGADFDIGGLIQQFSGLAESFKGRDFSQIGSQIGSLIETFRGFFSGSQQGGGPPGGAQPRGRRGSQPVSQPDGQATDG